jgi:hypothetical protein
MTNLQAMQDEQLLELIRDVEKLERLRNSLPYSFSHEDMWDTLQDDLEILSNRVAERWKELTEEERGLRRMSGTINLKLVR